MWGTGRFKLDYPSGAEFFFEVKHFAEGSQFGIDGGKISKLYITRDGREIASYERGWSVKPADEEAKRACAAIIAQYN